MAEIDQEVQSPCIGICAVDDSTNLCQGCFRTLGEIQDWWELDNEQKQVVVDEAMKRSSALFD